MRLSLLIVVLLELVWLNYEENVNHKKQNENRSTYSYPTTPKWTEIPPPPKKTFKDLDCDSKLNPPADLDGSEWLGFFLAWHKHRVKWTLSPLSAIHHVLILVAIESVFSPLF